MDTMNEEKESSLKPYDDSMWEQWSMYDSMPYIWDPDLNVDRVFRYESGNIIKAYRYNLQDTFEIKYE